MPTAAPDPSADPAAAVRTLFAAVDAHDVDRAVSVFADAYRGRDVSRSAETHGPEQVRRELTRGLEAFPDLSVTLHRTLTRGTEVAAEWSVAGTHTASFLRIPPTGRCVEVHGFGWFTVEHGSLTASVLQWDLAGLLRRLKLLPELPG